MDMEIDYITPDDLDCVYRVDRYSILDTTEKDFFTYEEIFMVCGDNSILRVIDTETGFMYIQMYDKSFYYRIGNDLGKTNELRKALMVYDYCVSQLRQIKNRKEALDSRFFALKSTLQVFIQQPSLGFEIDYFKFISKHEMHEMEKRCKYLAHAYELEWNGVVDMKTVKSFNSIPEIDHYAFQRGLFKYGEGFDKRIDDSCVYKMDFAAEDILSPVRKVDDELGRLKGKDGLTQEQLLQQNLENAPYIKAETEVQKLLYQCEEVVDKLEETTSKSKAKMLEKKHKRLTEKITNELPYVVFFPEL